MQESVGLDVTGNRTFRRGTQRRPCLHAIRLQSCRMQIVF